MLSDVMEHFGLSKSFRHVDAFETEHHRQLLKDLKLAIHEGGLIALTGMLGSGKTVLLGRLQDQLRQEGQIEVAESLMLPCPASISTRLNWLVLRSRHGKRRRLTTHNGKE